MTASLWRIPTTMNSIASDSHGLDAESTQRTDLLSVTDYAEYQAARIINEAVPPCIFLLGSFGNIATIFLMRRIKDHNSSQHILLMALAMSDLTFLWFVVPDWWIYYAFDFSLLNVDVSLCKLVYWMTYVSGATSAWLVTCVTVQRTMAVLWPHRMRAMCTVRRSWIVAAVIALSAGALYSHLLYGLALNTGKECTPATGLYDDFFYSAFSWIDLCFASLLPSACLIVCDVVLSATLFQAVAAFSAADRVQAYANPAHSAHSRRTTALRTTVLVLAISGAFLLLTLPLCGYIIWPGHNDTDSVNHPQAKAVDALLGTVTQQLWFTNSAVNFALYCLTGPKFRRQLMGWVRCRGAATPASAPPSATRGSCGGGVCRRAETTAP